MILQCKSILNHNIIFYIPWTDNEEQTRSLSEFISETIAGAKIQSYYYPKSLYSLTRQSNTLWLKLALLSFISLLKLIFDFNRLAIKSHNLVWINGNKVGLPLLIYLKIFKYKKTCVYHLRDYPTAQFPFSILWRLLRLPFKCQKIIVSNSYDVDRHAKLSIGENSARFLVCYNPVDLKIDKKNGTQFSKIGLASMLVDWKGIHFVINFMNIYKEKLKEIGVEELLIFGENIYHTDTSKSNYTLELKILAQKNEGIKFMGNCSPEEIYSKVDLLIHPSLKAEPFGRIIVEAFRSNVPVVSTGLGGASELILDNLNGHKCIPFDYAGLFQIILKLKNYEHRIRIIENANESDFKINKQQVDFWRELNQVV